jgi:soluble lytic murein transglycosylase
MSSRSATARRGRRRPPSRRRSASGARRRAGGRQRRGAILRRRLLTLLLVAGAAVLGAVAILPQLNHAVQEITLPLKHEDIIRQQAHEKGLDPALVAAVIYTESKFRDATSSAGALGLMQLTPDTARFIARRSGGFAFTVKDLSTPQVNIAYGSFYLRYLLERYAGNDTLALAAYNGGEGNVDKWVDAARQAEHDFTPRDIPFPETRAYVRKVLSVRDEYARTYRRELGL